MKFPSGKTPLQWALHHVNTPEIVYIRTICDAKHGDICSEKKKELLARAALDGDCELLEQLISHGVPVNTPFNFYRRKIRDQVAPLIRLEDSDKWDGRETRYTALHLATMACQPQAVRLLCQLGADPNAIDHNEYTAFDYAVFTSNVSIIRCLCEYGADLERDVIEKALPSVWECNDGYQIMTTVLWLGRFGVKYDQIDDSKILSACIRSNNVEAFSYFLRPFIVKKEDISSMISAAIDCDACDVIRYLYRYGADLTAANKDQVTPIMDTLLNHKDDGSVRAFVCLHRLGLRCDITAEQFASSAHL